MAKKSKKAATTAPATKTAAKKAAIPKRAGDDAFDVSGKVDSFRKNHHDDIDGLILASGAEIRFPPHLGPAVTEIVEPGDKVHILGRHHETDRGDTHLHAESIENPKTGKVVEIERDAGKKHAKKHKKKHAKKHHKSAQPPSHEQMLIEIHAIRALLEKRPRKPHESNASPHERVLEELRALRRSLQG